ncbi:ZIP family metal transporter, partial [Patescibacteria group bacterium AH-259-L05]|nr:ZIP family metal transporter [Patescibacteria group bacterium AH-259-L05]
LGFVAFSAGALIGSAFLHLIPEAIEMVGSQQVLTIFLYVIIGFCTFFILENFISFHHHIVTGHEKRDPFSYLVLISDAVHNFLDGLIIAASFIAAIPIGIVTAVAVGLHEIPQEIGDFGILVYGGFKKTRALVLNFISASTVIVGGIVGFFLIGKVEQLIIFLLPFAAGNFIYIASSDLVPEIKHRVNIGASIIHFFIFLLGIVLMALLRFFAGE